MDTFYVVRGVVWTRDIVSTSVVGVYDCDCISVITLDVKHIWLARHRTQRCSQQNIENGGKSVDFLARGVLARSCIFGYVWARGRSAWAPCIKAGHSLGLILKFTRENFLRYLSHCYTIAWDRLSNQFLFVCVCMYVSVGTLTVAFFNRSSRNLGSESEELIRLGSKSENVFPYFNPPNPKIYRRDRQFPAKY